MLVQLGNGADNAVVRFLRDSKLTARLVLAWFALFVGAGLASPLIKPASVQMVCSASGQMKLVAADQDEGEVRIATGLDCPLCVSVMPPPALYSPDLAFASPLAHALRPPVAAHIAAATAPPLPSRGPPSIS